MLAHVYLTRSRVAGLHLAPFLQTLLFHAPPFIRDASVFREQRRRPRSAYEVRRIRQPCSHELHEFGCHRCWNAEARRATRGVEKGPRLGIVADEERNKQSLMANADDSEVSSDGSTGVDPDLLGVSSESASAVKAAKMTDRLGMGGNGHGNGACVAMDMIMGHGWQR